LINAIALTAGVVFQACKTPNIDSAAATRCQAGALFPKPLAFTSALGRVLSLPQSEIDAK